MVTRVIVCGGRDFQDKEKCFESLDVILAGNPHIEIVSGHAKGADSFGEEYAKKHGISVKVFRPDWKRYGRGAGPIRNKEMLEYAAEEEPMIIAFWDGKSKGTKNMINQAIKAGANVKIIKETLINKVIPP